MTGNLFELVLSAEEIKSLEETRWPGRCQIIELPEKSMRLFLDGAHTLESLSACTSWFQNAVGSSSSAPRALIFNCSFDRNPSRLLGPMKALQDRLPFGAVVFCPNVAFAGPAASGDTENNMAPPNPNLSFQFGLKKAWEDLGLQEASVVSSVAEAIALVAATNTGPLPTNVLMTGSLHLVGATFSALNLEVR